MKFSMMGFFSSPEPKARELFDQNLVGLFWFIWLINTLYMFILYYFIFTSSKEDEKNKRNSIHLCLIYVYMVD